MSKTRKNGKTSKTSQVLNLLTGESEKPNPLLWAGIPKDKVIPPEDGGNPHLYTGEEVAALYIKSPPSLQKGIKNDGETPLRRTAESDKEVISVNLIEIIAKEEIGYILQRFNTCQCERCCEKAVELVCQKIAPRYINKLSNGNWQDPIYAQKQKNTSLSIVSKEAIKTIISRKRKPFHKT